MVGTLTGDIAAVFGSVASRRHVVRAAAAGILAGGALGAFRQAAAAGRIDGRLQELKITVPELSAPLANYVPYTRSGPLVFVAGQLPMKEGKLMHPGKVPTDVSLEQAQEAARQCAINIIAAVKAACGGDLDRVERCLQLQGFVASADTFTDQPKVMNGASDLIATVFGDAGKHARVAVGVNTLPLNTCVEVAGVFAVA